MDLTTAQGVLGMADRDRSWGERLREWRESTMRWSQQELVDHVVQLAFRTKADRGSSLSVGLLQKWENGTVRRPHYSYQRLLAELGAPVPQRKITESPPDVAEAADRKGASELPSHADESSLEDGVALSVLRSTIEDPPGDSPSIAEIRAMSDSFQLADRKLGGGKLYRTVSDYLKSAIAPRLFDPPNDCSSPELFSAAASLTEIAGWMAHDGGDNSRARDHLSQAYRLAVAGENAALSANVCASMAHLAVQLERPDDAVRISTAGLNHVTAVDGAEHLVARLWAMQARGYAAKGLDYEFHTALQAARDSLMAGSSDRPTIGWIADFDEASLAGESALSFLALGSLTQAEYESRRVVHLRSGDRSEAVHWAN